MVKKVVNYLVINLSCFRSFFHPKNGLNPTITVRKRAKYPYTSRNQCANMLIFSLSHKFFYIFFTSQQIILLNKYANCIFLCYKTYFLPTQSSIVSILPTTTPQLRFFSYLNTYNINTRAIFLGSSDNFAIKTTKSKTSTAHHPRIPPTIKHKQGKQLKPNETPPNS